MSRWFSSAFSGVVLYLITFVTVIVISICFGCR
jgi:hypothetical protein